jgi:diaminopimelate decarboxylase
MNHFDYRSGPTGADELYCEDVRLADIAETVGTPVYVYSTATLRRHFSVFRDALSAALPGRKLLIAYAVKANSNLSVLKTLAELGAGADTVSEGEVRRALAAGVPPERVVFSGVGKTDAELAFALEAGIAEINIESEPELDRLSRVATKLGRTAEIAIRVNPDIGAGGHAKISTGKTETKFGVSLMEAERLYAKAATTPGVKPVGLATHIGSQITDLAPLAEAFATLRALAERLRAEGLEVKRLDLGGGLGVPYFNAPEPPDPAAYAAMVAKAMEGFDCELAFEPGRVIVANAGVLVSRVVHIHERPGNEGRRFMVLDAAMNDLIRPTLYEAYHEIVPVVRRAADALPYDVVGPVCETGDIFTKARALAPQAAGDLMAFLSAGAYGAVMASEYNSRPLVPEVLVNGSDWAVVRRRPTLEEMLAREPLAGWL